jgi:CBS domain-containing protein
LSFSEAAAGKRRLRRKAQMRIRDIMKSDVRTISPVTPLVDAAELMRIHGIRHLVVVEGGAVAGVISNRDLAAITRRELEQLRARDVMLRHVITVTPETTISQAANKMRSAGIGSLPVLEEGKLAGIVTTTDVLELVGRNYSAKHRTMRYGREMRK